MKIVLLFAFTLVLNTFSHAQSCWNVKEDADIAYKELSSTIVLSFRDAVECTPIENAKVTLFGQEFYTNIKGEIELPTPPDDVTASDIVHLQKNGYIDLKQKVDLYVGTFSNSKFLVTKKIPLDQARFILSWGASPLDLDLHIKSDDFHISYRNKRGDVDQVQLDQDAMNGYGPETITIKRLNENKKYDVLVHQYSSNGNFDTSVNLSIYANSKLDKSVQFPNMNARCVKVATIYNNKIHYKFEVQNNQECK